MAKERERRSQRGKQIKKLVGTNAFALVLIGIGTLLAKIGFPYLLPIAGLCGLILPNLNLINTTEQLSGLRQGLLSRILWLIIISLTITPTTVWVISSFIGQTPLDFVQSAFYVWWAITLLLALIFHWFGRSPESTEEPINSKEVWLLLGLFVVAVIGAAIIYPFIPEADSYTYLIKLEQAKEIPLLFKTDGRPIFLILVELFGSITRIDPYWLFKLGLPLLNFSLVLTIYLAVQSSIKQPWLRLVASLSPLYFPIIFQELLISRPQSILLIVMAPAIYFFGKFSLNRSKPGSIYWVLLLTLIGLVGLKIHTLFAFILPLGLIAPIVFYWPYIIRRPLDSVILFLASGLALYPWISNTGLIGDIREIGQLAVDTIGRSHFTWWFIDNYRNVDGNEAGWPGLTALFYYGYNLGVFLPGALLLLIINWSKRSALATYKTRQLWPAWVIFGFFFVIAEVAPRFGLAFLPDRAWILVALPLCFFLPAVLLTKSSTKNPISPWHKRILISLSILAILSSWGITYIKDGWIDSKDYSAVSFIKAKMPSSSVFLTQGGNHVLIRYFSERQMVRPLTDIFTPSDPSAVEEYLKQQAEVRKEGLKNNLDRRNLLKKEIQRIDSEYNNLSSANQPFFLAQKKLLEGEYNEALEAQRQLLTSYPTVNNPVYLLYSQNKFRSIYASRSWWRSSNFYGAKLEKFSRRYPVIYNHDGVTIWEVKK